MHWIQKVMNLDGFRDSLFLSERSFDLGVPCMFQLLLYSIDFNVQI